MEWSWKVAPDCPFHSLLAVW